MRIIIADGAYSNIEKWLSKLYEWILQVSKINEKGRGFQPVPQRWKVERTFSWFNWNRRIIIDYERTMSSSETMVYIANIALILKKF